MTHICSGRRRRYTSEEIVMASTGPRMLDLAKCVHYIRPTKPVAYGKEEAQISPHAKNEVEVLFR